MPKAKPVTPAPGQFWLAKMETRHFSFKATGATQEEAQAALVQGWAEHRKQAGAIAQDMPAADINVLEEEFGVNYMEMQLGQCWRDYTVVSTSTL